MSKKRIMFSLFTDGEYFYLSRNFRLQRVGNLEWLMDNYDFQNVSENVDELIIYNINREERIEDKFINLLSSISKNLFLPLTVGGQIRTEKDAVKLLESGSVDKLSLCSALVHDINFVSRLRRTYGQQFIVAKFDFKIINNQYIIMLRNGLEFCTLRPEDVIREVVEAGVGELHLNSIDRDGTGMGLDLNLLALIQDNLSTPTVLSGGVGKSVHYIEGLVHENISGVCCGHLFNFIGNGLKEVRKQVQLRNVSIANFM